MRLTGFRILNFRSIVDSGWNNLSPDNITALIGQNESGKTSVLEALHSFFLDTVSEDVLRSDMSLPEVSCSYQPEPDEGYDFIDQGSMPPGVMEAIKENNHIVLTRKWMQDLNSRITLDGPGVSVIFEEIDKTARSLTDKGIKGIDHLIRECENIQSEIKSTADGIINLEKELDTLNRQQSGFSKLSKRGNDREKKETINRSMEDAAKKIEDIGLKLKAEKDNLQKKKSRLADKEFIRGYGLKCREFFEEMNKTDPQLEKAWKDLIQIENSLPFLQTKKEIKAGDMRLFQAKEKYIMLSRKMESLKENFGISIRLVTGLLDGKQLSEAEREARDEFEKSKTLCSREEAGDIFFRHIPHYEFFEDFSSLLPNRIDLEDIFEDDTRVEGYKAVRNFLLVAGLEPEFFKQVNNRILKQKIENLNQEVTVDFQEYWRQNVGKTNKIRINFELEHYDISHPEKKGKPYLEFWVKDEHERLYPKQRSRGVRWFLSFYLELKAYAKQNEELRRVLLIDEPGLSLHARAQEDVLKVFEDIRGKIQIIYTTHSPHLIDINKLYRLLAVQRARENSEHSETLVFDATHLHSATSDTLSPVYSLMGTGLHRQELVKKSNNVIVEDITCFYYLSAFYKLIRNPGKLHFLPASGPARVTTLVNLLIGWGFDFSVLLFDNEENRESIRELKNQLTGFDPDESLSRLRFADNIPGPEDLFSTLDFKNHIIKKRIGISESNSEFIRQNELSRPLLASSFAQSVSSGILTIDDFDEETKSNLRELFDPLIVTIMTSDET